jgi:hypothetical protein
MNRARDALVVGSDEHLVQVGDLVVRLVKSMFL